MYASSVSASHAVPSMPSAAGNILVYGDDVDYSDLLAQQLAGRLNLPYMKAHGSLVFPSEGAVAGRTSHAAMTKDALLQQAHGIVVVTSSSDSSTFEKRVDAVRKSALWPRVITVRAEDYGAAITAVDGGEAKGFSRGDTIIDAIISGVHRLKFPFKAAGAIRRSKPLLLPRTVALKDYLPAPQPGVEPLVFAGVTLPSAASTALRAQGTYLCVRCVFCIAPIYRSNPLLHVIHRDNCPHTYSRACATTIDW